MRARLFGTIQHRYRPRTLWQYRQQVFRGERAIEADFQHTHFFAPAQQFIYHLFTGANRGTHDHNHALRLRMAIILERFVLASGSGGKIGHRLIHMVINRVVPRVSGLAGLEIGIGVGGGAADHRMLRVQRAGAVGVNLGLREQIADGVIGNRHNLVDFVRGAEPIEEVNKGHPAFQRRHVGDEGEILRLLHAAGTEQGAAGLAHGHHVRVIAKN